MAETSEELTIIEELTGRCGQVESEIKTLAPTKVTENCANRLLKLVHAEFNFLSKLSSSSHSRICSNIGYVEAILHVLQQPNVQGVTGIGKKIQVPSVENLSDAQSKECHVDIVGMIDGRPVWFFVTSRKPKYIFWSDKCNESGLKTHLQFVKEVALSSGILQPESIILCFSKGLEVPVVEKLKEEIGAVENVDFIKNAASLMSNDVSLDQQRVLPDGFSFQETENGEWINVTTRETGLERFAEMISSEGNDSSTNNSQHWLTFEIKIKNDNLEQKNYKFPSIENRGRQNLDYSFVNYEQALNSPTTKDASCSAFFVKEPTSVQHKKFYSLLTALDASFRNHDTKIGEVSWKSNLVNLDTTALVALVSGLSNGCAKRLAEMPEKDMWTRFKTTTHFMREQAKSELQHPLLDDALSVLSGKTAMICDSVNKEFNNLVSICGGPDEKHRAKYLLNHIVVLQDKPTSRVLGLRETGNIKLKHKVIFGTGDYYQALTLTSNMRFVRAVMQTGMSLATVEHRPRALVGV